MRSWRPMEIRRWPSVFPLLGVYAASTLPPLFENNIATTQMGRFFSIEGRSEVKLGGPLGHRLYICRFPYTAVPMKV